MIDYNQQAIDRFFTRGIHKDLDVYWMSQPLFDITERAIRNNCSLIFLRDVENNSRVTARFDLSYDELKDLRGEAWKEQKNYYLCIDRFTKKREG